MIKAPKFCHAIAIFKCLHRLKINERIEYKLLSLTYKAPTTAHPTICTAWSLFNPSLYSLLICRHPVSTTYIFSKITNRSFRYASPHLWNQLPVSFRQPCINHCWWCHTIIHLPHARHSHLQSIIHCFIPGSKLAFSTIFFPSQSAGTHPGCLLGLYWTWLILLNGFHF